MMLTRFARQEALSFMQYSGSTTQSGQERLRAAHVLVIGAGGLGCPVLTYLACAGVGVITVIDDDVVSVTNLNRQFLYGVADIGKSKVACCAQHFSSHYDDVRVLAQKHRLYADNIAELTRGADVLVDCVDNMETRFIVNDYAAAHNIPLVEGGVDGLYGFCLLMQNMPDAEGACLRCMSVPMAEQKSPSVLSTTTGVIGALQAQLCIQALLGKAAQAHNKIFHYDGYSLECEAVQIQQNPNCITCHKKIL